MLKEFSEFLKKGNVVDMAVGLVIGVAFGAVVKSLVTDIIMPPIGLLLGGIDFNNFFLLLKAGAKGAPPYASLPEAQAAGAVTINYGVFVNSIISFVVVAFAIFMLVKYVNKLKREKPVGPTTKECPYCVSTIPLKATRCPSCTSELRTAA
jgi:large conductance mechanosensitive channel